MNNLIANHSIEILKNLFDYLLGFTFTESVSNPFDWVFRPFASIARLTGGNDIVRGICPAICHWDEMILFQYIVSIKQARWHTAVSASTFKVCDCNTPVGFCKCRYSIGGFIASSVVIFSTLVFIVGSPLLFISSVFILISVHPRLDALLVFFFVITVVLPRRCFNFIRMRFGVFIVMDFRQFWISLVGFPIRLLVDKFACMAMRHQFTTTFAIRRNASKKIFCGWKILTAFSTTLEDLGDIQHDAFLSSNSDMKSA